MKDKKFLALVKKACNNNKEAFTEICEWKAREVIFLCFREMGNLQDGEDAAQEVFIRMQKNITQLRAPEAFNVWLNQLVYTTCMNMKRDAMKHKNSTPIETLSESLLLDSQILIPEAYAEDTENRKILGEILDALPDKYRTCLLLHYYQNLSYADIGEVMGISLDAVNYNMRMARKQLKFDVENHPSMQGGTTLWGVSSVALFGPALTTLLQEMAWHTVPPHVVQACLTGTVAIGAVAVNSGAVVAAATGITMKLVAQVALAATVVLGGTGGVYLVANNQPAALPPPASIVENWQAPVEQAQPVVAGRIFLTRNETADPTARDGLSEIELQLVRMEEEGLETLVVTTLTLGEEEQGNFAFWEIPPGRYYLRVNLPKNAVPVAGEGVLLEKLPLEENVWQLSIGGRQVFDVTPEKQDVLQNLQLEITLPAVVKGRIQLYATGAAIAFQDDLLPGVQLVLLDPQQKVVGSTDVTQNGAYEFNLPLVSQKGTYTLRLINDGTRKTAITIQDATVELYPGCGQNSSTLDES